MEMFEKASRLKLRFKSTKGSLSTEDLWDLSLASLDAVAKTTNKELKESAEESFITPPTATGSSTLELQMEILKYVISVRLAENEKKKAALQRKQELETLKQLRDTKKLEALGSLSEEELTKRIAELEAA